MRRHAVAALLMLASPVGIDPQAVRTAFAAGEDRAMALELFAQGREQLKNGNYSAALAQFEAAARGMRTFGVLFNIAECEEKLGRTASAWATWSEARALAAETQHADDERIASERQKVLEAELSRLAIVVPPDADSPQLEVKRDGILLPREAWGRALAVDPGPHRVEAHAPGRKAQALDVFVQSGGDNRSIALKPLEMEGAPLPAAVAAPSVAAAPTATVPPVVPLPVSTAALQAGPAVPPLSRMALSAPAIAIEPSSLGAGQRLAGWILAGLGLAAVGTGIGIAVHGQDQHNEAVATDLAGNLAQAQTMESNANTTKTVGYVTIGGGGAFLLTGIVLVLAAPSGWRQATTSASSFGGIALRPWATPTGGGASFSQSW